MKRSALFTASLLAAGALFGQAAPQAAPPAGKPLDSAADKLVRQALPVCSTLTLTATDFPYALPQGLSGRLVQAESDDHACDGRYGLVTSAAGTWYFGTPWFIGEAEGASIEQKLQNFMWTNLQTNVSVTLDRKRSSEGLFGATLWQVTERGKIPLEGLVDADGRVFFLGLFYPQAGDAAKGRVSSLQPLIANAPARGTSSPAVTIVEFSDFQCPSCKRTSTVAESVMSRHADQVRYVRFDLPLITAHPWAFSASLAGRAIYRQKPDLFWEYKKQVYENQERLNAFVFDDFARGFAEDRGLDMARYDADVASEVLRDELLKGVGAAFSNQVRATPTFMVNGVFVTTGPEGKELGAYVAAQLRQ